MKIEIFSDVVCPWCYIGKRRFEKALAEFDHANEVELVWHSYQLDPSAPRHSNLSVNEMLSKKYGMTLEQAKTANERVSSLAAQEGLEYHLEKAKHGNTFDAHRLIQLAATHNLQDEVEERLFKAYFTEGAVIDDSETLVKLVSEVGIDAEEARGVLASAAYAEEVRNDEVLARELGIQGVPFFVLEEKYGISGAQPTEMFSAALEQVWDESHSLTTLNSPTQEEAGLCEGDSCAIS